MKDYKRADRVADLFYVELSNLLKREIADPRLKNITISVVKVSDDLGHAKVYFTLFEPNAEKIRQVLKGLKSASGFLRSHLARVSALRKVPTLMFYYDDHLDHASKMTSLIEKVAAADEQHFFDE